MCGIFGVLNHYADKVPDDVLLHLSAKKLQHRGPDNQTIYRDNDVGFVHTRLALLDLSERSNQPFFSKDKQKCLIYNGELYNFIEIREDLQAKGIEFRTTSDTEVLLEAILNYGINTSLKLFDGMFAFAVYDFSQKTLTLARDRFGIKPLFYCDQERQFLFASELSAIIPWIHVIPNIPSIMSYLHGFGGPTKGQTFVQNVRIANPGEIITIRKGKHAHYYTAITITELYDQGYQRDLRSLSKKQVVDKADELLFASVKKQLMADVPVGAFCSGGVDSSLVMAMAARLHSDLAVFHANVMGHDSELDAATLLARYLRLDLQFIDTDQQDFISLIPEIILHYSHPYVYHPNSVPFYKVSQLVREKNIKAVLSGEGSDECFIGYQWLLPNSKAIVKDIFKQSLVYSIKNMVDRFIGRPKIEENRVSCNNHLIFLEEQMDNWNIERFVLDDVKTSLNKKDLTSLQQLHYHLRTLLHRNDCLGMASSIESRFPFLDSNVVKFAINLPYQYKVGFSPFYRHDRHDCLVDKWIVRTVASRYLPHELAFRKKIGFPTSAQSRMKISLDFFENGFVFDLYGMLKNEFIDFYSNLDQDSMLKLMQTEVWAQLFLNQISVDSLTEKIEKNIAYA